jgi:polyhydroxybutyrate depolymerase
LKKETVIVGLLLGSALLVLTMVGAPPASAAELLSWRVEGQTREAIVYAPTASTTGGRRPLVMAFHGYGDDAEHFQFVNLHRAWPDAVVAYFQGLPTRGGLPGWQVERGQYDDRDLKLVDAALAGLRKQFSIDDERIYATGFSNGAMLTYLLWAERPQVFAAYAPVAGRLRPSVQPTERRPVLHIGGARDTQVAFAGQKAAFEEAIRVNGVSGHGQPCGEGCTLYGAGTAAPVMVSIHQGAHTYPNGTSEAIVRFLRQYARRSPLR